MLKELCINTLQEQRADTIKVKKIVSFLELSGKVNPRRKQDD